MRLTFGSQYYCLWRSTMMLMSLALLCAVSLAQVGGWEHDNDGSNALLAEGSSCKTKTGESGICKILESCAVYVDGLVKKTIKYGSIFRCSFKGITEVICCPNTSANTKDAGAVNTTPSTKAVTTRVENEKPSQAACRRYSAINPASLAFHILDGVAVNPGDYPHVGALLYNGDLGVEVRCGSSLISERYVLTAAHCVNDPLAQPFMVRLGVVAWNSTDDGILPVDVEIENTTFHKDYNSFAKYHDLALLRLKKPVEFTPLIKPACLYSDLKDVDSNIPLVVTGWGVTDVQTKATSEVLLMTNVTTVPLQSCNDTHNDYGVARSYANGLNAGQYCAFDIALKKDSCQGDSGGPLQLVDGKTSTIVGIVSFGRSCGISVPSIYARVAYYLDWIESIVWPS